MLSPVNVSGAVTHCSFERGLRYGEEHSIAGEVLLDECDAKREHALVRRKLSSGVLPRPCVCPVSLGAHADTQDWLHSSKGTQRVLHI